ncbi:MAG: HDIG domain-containing protein [Candidatus Adiutrix sp.]|jgi:putative nucleotidyltransferase with HDIG domain|nr:HDIG domain-containing protein [Candidatus Adiutrix sp.]
MKPEKAKAAAPQAGPACRPGHILGLKTRDLKVQVWLWGLMSLLAVFLAYPAPIDYQVGQVAEHTIRADRGFQFLDRAATERKKLEAESQVFPVFMLDDLLPGFLERQARELFREIREFLADGGQEGAEHRPAVMADFKSDFLRLFNLQNEAPVWPDLIERNFSENLEKRALGLAVEIMGHGIPDESALNLLGAASAVTVISVSTGAEYIKPRLDALLGRRELGRLLDVQARKLAVEYGQRDTDLILTLAQGLAQPNLRPDQRLTQDRLLKAAAGVPDIYVDVRPGQVIVHEGTVIDQEAMEKLKALSAGQRREINWLSRFAGLFLALFLFYNLILTLLSLDNLRHLILVPPREQLFMALVVLLTVLTVRMAMVFGIALSWEFDFVDNHTIFFGLPLPAAIMLTGVFFNLRRTTLMLILVAVTSAVVIPGEGRFMALLYMVNGGIVAALCLRNMKERKALVPASFWVMVVNCLTLLSLTLYSDSVWGGQTVNNFLAAAACGFFSGVLTSGFIPLAEMAFGFNTNLKMLELGNLDRPLLRELMLSAPGTYHHSVTVGAMVEAAAEAIGANPYVAKVGAYYHDIGKMKKPLYFVENQSGENRHDTLAPSMSALVLVGHVREGADLARANQLPKNIIDIIEQHHGVSLMGFFYHKAKEHHHPGQPEVNEGDFRYPGPKPRSPEAGLVMLGDICEASTRSLAERTPVKIKNMVKSVVNQAFSDGQLDECDLKASEIAVVVSTFTTILIGIYHQRVAYPGKKAPGPPAAEAPWPEGGKTKEPAYAHLSVEPPKGPAH